MLYLWQDDKKVSQHIFKGGRERKKRKKEKKWGCQSTANHISLQCVFVHHLRLSVFSLWIHPQFTKDSLFCWHGSSIDMGRRLWRLAPLYLLECIWKECGILGFLQVWSIPHWSWQCAGLTSMWLFDSYNDNKDNHNDKGMVSGRLLVIY